MMQSRMSHLVRSSRLILLAMICVAPLTSSSARAQTGPQTKSQNAPLISRPSVPVIAGRMERDPDLSFQEVDDLFPTGLREVWLLALRSTEAEARQLAARSITIADQQGLSDWDAAESLLLKNLSDPHRGVRLSSAEAIVQLNLRTAAAALAEAADQDGLEMSRIVEPALADWGVQSRAETWMAWLQQATEQQGLAKLAMRSLAAIKHPAAVEPLRQIAVSNPKMSLRMAAARALGRFAESGMEDDAETLAKTTGDGPRAIPRVIAATILKSHRSERSAKLLQELLQDSQPTVITAAAAGLLTRDPDAIVEQHAHVLQHGDANSRRLLVEALYARFDQSQNLSRLADRLDDLNPTVRSLARERLMQLNSQAELRSDLIEQARRMLQAGSWRSTEQAARMLAELKDVEAASLLVDSLEHPRPEAYVTVAWALAELSPTEQRERAFGLFQERFEFMRDQGAPTWRESGYEEQCAHLIQWFGYTKFEPVDEILRSCVPKSFPNKRARRAALWALGYLHQDQAVESLARAMVARLEDVNSPEPEELPARVYCAISLGRMKAELAYPNLRNWLELDTVINDVGAACAWALNYATGLPIPEAVPEPGYRSGFFLERLTE